MKEDHHEDVKISSLEPAGRKDKGSPCKNECRSQKEIKLNSGRTYPFRQ